MNCTGCPALRMKIVNGYCVAGVRTGTVKARGMRVRHPMETCKKPRNDSELAQRIELVEIERRGVV